MSDVAAMVIQTGFWTAIFSYVFYCFGRLKERAAKDDQIDFLLEELADLTETLLPLDRDRIVRNGRRHSDNRTGFKGVHRSKGRFAATLMVSKKKIWLGRFDTPEQAHKAYCEAAIRHHGEFAQL